MPATISAAPAATNALTLSRYICDANQRYAAALEITFRWHCDEASNDLRLAPEAAEVLNRFILTIRNRSARKARLEITFTHEHQNLAVSARYMSSSTSAVDAPLFEAALFDHGTESVRKRFTLSVESFAYWEEARLAFQN